MLRVLAVCSLPLLLPAVAKSLTVSEGLPLRGQAVAQRFLPGGVSVVTTAADRVCLVSQRIDIAASDYRGPNGNIVNFADVVRSPATVTQAMAGADGAITLRVQLKFSPAPDAGIVLELPDGARDIATLLEPSGDSLLIAGDLAENLAAAFEKGARPTLRSVSKATGRTVTDRLDAPDLAALGGCAAQLATAEPAAEEEAPAMLLRAVFEVEPSPETIASPGVMQACGMPDQPETLYLGRLQGVTGFVSHTDKVFVSYSTDGAIERVYIPGIYEVDLRAPGDGIMRVSRAANSNVPAEPNTVSGCIGSEVMAVCHSDLGDGAHAMTACQYDGMPDLFSSREFTPPLASSIPLAGLALPGAPQPSLPPLQNRRFATPFFGGGGGGGGGTVSRPPNPPGTPIPTSTPGTPTGGTPPDPLLPPSPVPLPAGVWLLLTALGGLAGLRRLQASAACDRKAA